MTIVLISNQLHGIFIVTAAVCPLKTSSLPIVISIFMQELGMNFCVQCTM